MLGASSLRLGVSNHFVMHYHWFEIDQKVLVFGIIFGDFHIITGEAFDSLQAFPKGQCDEMGDVAFTALENMNTNIPLGRLIIGNGAFIGEFTIGIRFNCGDSTMPHSDDHLILLFRSVSVTPLLIQQRLPVRHERPRVYCERALLSIDHRASRPPDSGSRWSRD